VYFGSSCYQAYTTTLIIVVFFIQPFYGGFSGLFRFLLLLKSFSILRRRTYQEFLELFSIVTHTHTRLTALCPGLPGWADTRKVKPIWILLKQETVSGSGISWAVCKSVSHSRQITTPAPRRSVFYRPDAFPAAQPTASKH